MMSGETMGFVMHVVEFMAVLFIFAIGLVVAAIIVIYILDRTQTKHAIRRNYPVVGHFRYLFEHLGEFFRQYFFAMDREELPFNRAQRSWAYRAAKDPNPGGVGLMYGCGLRRVCTRFYVCPRLYSGTAV